jgi:molybdate transport system substrate-binding protein
MSRLRLVLLAAALLGAATARAGDPIALAAAASLRTVLPELVAAFQGGSGSPAVRTSFGASGALRRQVEAGAPVDAVLLAGAEEVDALIAQGIADPSTRCVLATNALVLIGPRAGAPLDIDGLASLPAGERIAIGDPRSVPAGRYAQRVLEGRGSWQSLAPRLVFAADASGVLALVRRGEAAAGFAYETDAQGVDEVRVLERATRPGDPRPEVVGAVIREGARAGDARRLLEFARSPAGQAVLTHHGFGPPP